MFYETGSTHVAMHQAIAKQVVSKRKYPWYGSTTRCTGTCFSLKTVFECSDHFLAMGPVTDAV